MKNDFTIGKVLKPRGLLGVIKIETYTETTIRFQNLKKIKLDGQFFVVENVSAEHNIVYFKLEGIDTIEQAETLRGKIVTANRNDLPAPPSDRFYIVDMIGIDVYVAGDRIGELVDILQYGSADVYVVKLENGSVSVPALKETILSVDLESGKLVLDERMFQRTAVYN